MKWPDDYIGKVIEGDCLEVMKDMPDKCVDLVLTDPPYGIGEAAGKNRGRGLLAKPKDYGSEGWDNKPVAPEYIDEVMRVAENQIIFGGNFYSLPPTACWIVWDKDNYNTDFADCELAWTSFPSAVRKIKWTWNGMLQEDMKDKDVRYHPTQKPLGVMKWIIRNYTKETDTILDPFLGSGTTAVAAEGLNRKWIGIEKEAKYCEIARRRLAAVQKEMFT
jgi:DNA modification methylase